ncbi:MAG: winged helix DNA-binding domain-containing protein [Bacteroidota bacterium]|nr:winged helix DNA-binding domain-containing protein [Bacteroidota bacterium]MDP4196558.1 winged helix DNA-binding domain-containing protein [Bacteroidota bacterium]
MRTKGAFLDHSLITSHRLNNQQITNTKLKNLDEISNWLCAIQAQDYFGAKWSFGLRLPGTSDDDVEMAINNRIIVRSWPMRSTLHFVNSKDIRWIIKLLAARRIKARTPSDRALGLDEKIFSSCNAILEKELSGGKHLTREEITHILKSSGFNTDANRVYHILQYAALNLLVCFGKRRGKQFTFTLLDEWIPKSTILDRDEALAELAKRYFFSRGPAEIKDFTWWSGLTASEAKTAIEMIRNQLDEIKVDGHTYWLSRQSNDDVVKRTYLLPGFDEYMMSYKDRTAVIDKEFSKVLNSGNGMLSPTIVIDGKIAGTWKRKILKDTVKIDIKLFSKLSKAEYHELNLAADFYRKFYGLKTYLLSES